jgi:murein DD-endopeptidase MepM/ murein hydrolase activator NlpD
VDLFTEGQTGLASLRRRATTLGGVIAAALRHPRAIRTGGAAVDAVRQYPRAAVATTALAVAGFLFLTVNIANAGPKRPVAGEFAAVGPVAAADRVAADRADAGQRADRTARRAVMAPVNAPARAKVVRPSWVKPMQSYKLTSCYEYRTDPYPQFHQGIDFANKAGTAIRAVHAGKVIMSGDNGDGYGNKIVVNHGDGTYALYGHGSRVAVHAGQRVIAGQVVSYEGSTGDSTGPHLHFEIWKGSQWHRIEPASFLRAHGVKVGC